MKSELSALIVLNCVILSVKSQGPPVSPCPDIYHYENDGLQWFGVIVAPSPPTFGSEMTIRIKMAVQAEVKSEYLGKIELAEDRNSIVRRIRRGWPVRYKVFFPLTTPLPYMINIKFSGRTICSGPSVTGRVVTAIDLEHTLFTGSAALINPPKNQYSYDDSPKEIVLFQEEEARLSQLTGDEDESSISFNPKPPQENNKNVLCGTTKSVNPLIITGDTAARGDWPWLIAIFVKRPRGLDFVCAGSLISDRIILTAAHCVQKTPTRTVRPQELVVKLGIHNLQDWTEETAVTKAVSRIKVHESYDKGPILNADIALLFLTQSVTYTDYVRPVCLWTGNDDPKKIVGKNGFVIGWGKDERGSPTTPEPRIARVPIVSTADCRASRPEFFHLTSEHTICAGARDGTGPCNGDSGGGMYLKDGSRWYIRGIVSNSLKDIETNSCNLDEYVVYTDAAKYIPWIRRTIS